MQAGALFSLRDLGYVLTVALLSTHGDRGNRAVWLSAAAAAAALGIPSIKKE